MIDPEFFGERGQHRVELLTLAIGLTIAVVLLVVRGWPDAAGMAAGTVAAWLNFRWMRRFVGHVARISLAQAGTASPKMPKGIFWKLIGRYALLGLVLYVILLRFYWPVVAFLCGLLTLVAAVLLEVFGELVLTARRSMLT